MLLVSSAHVESLARNDATARRLDAWSLPGDDDFVCQKWLRQSAPKRFIHDALYGDLFAPMPRRGVLDVGGGLTALTRELARMQDYCLVEMLAHDTREDAERMMVGVGTRFIVESDWAQLPAGQFDIVIANDLFPNVDQRLEPFLLTFLPHCREMRLSLTYYDTPRHYFVRRLDAEEILCFQAWNGAQLQSVLARFADRIDGYVGDTLAHAGASVYPNGRQVCLVVLRGDRT